MSYELIETVEVGAGGAASIEFTSIPQDGTDLVLVTSLRLNDNGPIVALVRLNSDSGSNYDSMELRALLNTVSTSQNTGLTQARMAINTTDSTANTFNNSSFYISNYTSTGDKSISNDSVAPDNGADPLIYLFADKYSTSSPVTSVTVSTVSPDLLVEHSTASLYKITAA